VVEGDDLQSRDGAVYWMDVSDATDASRFSRFVKTYQDLLRNIDIIETFRV
jgi:hypothetical protein